MISPAPGPNYFPWIEYRQVGNKTVTNFTGWKLMPVPGQPGQQVSINPKIPASARPYPNAWEHTSMFPEKIQGVPLPDGSGGFGVPIPGTKAFASDGSSHRGMSGIYGTSVKL